MPELTLLAAFVAGVISFLSPCVLPVVPAYLGQLGVVAVAGVTLSAATRPASAASGPGAAGSLGLAGGTLATTAGPLVAQPSLTRRRWQAMRAAVAFCLGFGAVFTLLGVTVYVGGSLGIPLPSLRLVGGIVLVVMGLNMMGIIRIDALWRSWRPLERTAAPATAGHRLGAGPLGAFGLGAIFAVGWTPCIGPTLGAILGLAALGPSIQAIGLFIAYAVGLAVPFLLLALTLDRAPALVRPLVRHGRAVELIGGGLVVIIGLALIFDWLGAFARAFSWLWPQV
jgi:cytochrome c-type biogenesis protein